MTEGEINNFYMPFLQIRGSVFIVLVSFALPTTPGQVTVSHASTYRFLQWRIEISTFIKSTRSMHLQDKKSTDTKKRQLPKNSGFIGEVTIPLANATAPHLFNFTVHTYSISTPQNM